MDYKHIYTDGSKDDMKVGCAVVSDDFSETMRIPDGSSIFTAEAKAIDLALDLIADCETSNKFITFSDSLSVLKSLDHTSSKNPQIQKQLEKHHELSELNEIVYCWIPSHIGIAGNESVDQKAKDSLNLHPTNFSIPYANFKSFINTVSHFSYAPLFQGPYFFTKMLESNILYGNLLINILSVC